MAAWSDHITVQQVTDQHEDVRWLQYNLRAEDYIELLETKTDITVFAFDDTMENYIAYDEDHMPLFLFGVSKEPLYGYGHLIWCVTRDDMYDRYRREFVAMGRYYLRRWKRRFPQMWNMVTDRNDKSKRWLRKMGASFSEPFLYNNMTWRLFTIGGADHVRSSRHDRPDRIAGNQPVQRPAAAIQCPGGYVQRPGYGSRKQR